MRRFLAVLRILFHPSLLCSFSCHFSPPTILPSSLTSYCHLFHGLPLNLVVPKVIYNTLLGILFSSILCTCPNQHNLFNPLNAELNPICHLLALLGVHHFLHVSRIRVNLIVSIIVGFLTLTNHLSLWLWKSDTSSQWLLLFPCSLTPVLYFTRLTIYNPPVIWCCITFTAGKASFKNRSFRENIIFSFVSVSSIYRSSLCWRHDRICVFAHSFAVSQTNEGAAGLYRCSYRQHGSTKCQVCTFIYNISCPVMDFDIIGFECSYCTSWELIKHILLSPTYIFPGSKGGIIHAGK